MIGNSYLSFKSKRPNTCLVDGKRKQPYGSHLILILAQTNKQTNKLVGLTSTLPLIHKNQADIKLFLVLGQRIYNEIE